MPSADSRSPVLILLKLKTTSLNTPEERWQPNVSRFSLC